jgi:hypothetical protein
MWCTITTKSEASLNRQILNNSVKRKAMENLYEIPRKLIHKELQSWTWIFSLTKTYRTLAEHAQSALRPNTSYHNKYCRNSWNIKCCTNANKFARTASANSWLGKKHRNVSLQTNWEYLSSIDVLSVDGTFKSAPRFTTNYLQFMDSQTITMWHLHFSYWPTNIKRPMMMCSDIEYQRLQHLLWNFVQQLFMLTSKLPFPKQWQ